MQELTARSPDGAAGVRTRVLLAILVAVTAGFLLAIARYEFGRDQAIFALIAEAMSQGGAPYRDVFDIKTPGVFFVYFAARALFGPGELALRLFEVGTLLALCTFVITLSRREIGYGAGVFAAFCAIYNLAMPGFWQTAQPESFAAVAIAAALFLATRTRDRGAQEFCAWVGVAALYAFAGLLKPTLGACIFVTFAFVLHQVVMRDGVRAMWRPTLAFSLGGAGVVALTCGYLVMAGGWADFIVAVFEIAPAYTRLGHETDLFSLVIQTCKEFARIWMFGVVGVALYLVMTFRSGGPSVLFWHISALVIVILAGVAIQAKLFPYHFATAAALAAIPAGWGFWLLWRDVLAGYRLGAVVLCVLFAAPMLYPRVGSMFWMDNLRLMAAIADPVKRSAISQDMHARFGVDIDAIRKTADWLKENAPDGDGTKLFVWGFEPQIYHISRLNPQSRFVYNMAQRSPPLADRMRAELIANLRADPPWAIVVQSGDVLEFVTGSPLDSREVMETAFHPLQNMVNEQYEPAITFGRLDVYTLRSSH